MPSETRVPSDQGDDDVTTLLSPAVASGQLDLATRIVARVLTADPTPAEVTGVADALRPLGHEVLRQHPVLALARGWAGIAAGDPGVASTGLIELAAASAGTTAGAPEPLALLVTTTAALLQQRDDVAYDAAATALTLVGAGVPRDAHGRDALAATLRRAAESLLHAGRVADARAAAATAIATAHHERARSAALAVAAAIDAVIGRHDEAAAALDGVEPGSPSPAAAAARTAVWLDRGDPRSVLAVDVARTDPWWPHVAAHRLLAQVQLGAGAAELHRIQALLRQDPAGIGTTLGAAVLRHALGTAHLAAGRLARAHWVLAAATPFPGQLAPGLLLATMLRHGPEAATGALPALTRLPGHTIRSRAGLAVVGAAAAQRLDAASLRDQLLEDAACFAGIHGLLPGVALLPRPDLAALRAVARGEAAALLAVPAEGTTYHPGVVITQR